MNPTDRLARMWTPVATHPDTPSVREHYRHRLTELITVRLVGVIKGTMTDEGSAELDAAIALLETEVAWQPRC